MNDIIAKVITDASTLKFGLDDFVSIGCASYAPSGFAVKTEKPWKTVDDFIAHGKRVPPGTLSNGTTGKYSTLHLPAEMFTLATGIAFNHIPFPGSAQADAAILGGHIDTSFGTVGRFSPRIKSGGMRSCVSWP